MFWTTFFFFFFFFWGGGGGGGGGGGKRVPTHPTLDQPLSDSQRPPCSSGGFWTTSRSGHGGSPRSCGGFWTTPRSGPKGLPRRRTTATATARALGDGTIPAGPGALNAKRGGTTIAHFCQGYRPFGYQQRGRAY